MDRVNGKLIERSLNDLTLDTESRVSPTDAAESELSSLLHAPDRIAGMVRSRIMPSRPSDQRSMYSRSSCIHCSNERLLRPETCQRQVNPGLTLKRRFCHATSIRTASRTESGRGPTILMSPSNTLISCGNSSMLVLRSHLPTRVVRGSLVILKIGPVFSFRCSSSCMRASASTHIVRNLIMRKRRLLKPTRS